MRKTMIALAAVAIILGTIPVAAPAFAKTEKVLVVKESVEVKVKNGGLSNPVSKPVPSPTKPEISGLKASDEITDYLWQKSLESGFSYFLLLGMAKKESGFNPSAISSTNDYGLMQINKRTGAGIARQLDIDSYNLLDYKTSINFSVYYLSQQRKYWDNKGKSGEDLINMVLMSYNRGGGGASAYYKKYGTYSSYVIDIRKYEAQFEAQVVE